MISGWRNLESPRSVRVRKTWSPSWRPASVCNPLRRTGWQDCWRPRSGAAAVAVTGLDPAALEHGARQRAKRGGADPAVSRDQLADRAARHAAAEGRPVAGVADLVSAVLAEAAEASQPLAEDPEAVRPPDVDIAHTPDVEAAPLSMGAESLLAELFAGSDPATVADLLTRCIDRHADVVAATGIDRATSTRWRPRPRSAARKGRHRSVGPISPARVGRHAGSRRSAVATPEDVAATVISLARPTVALDVRKRIPASRPPAAPGQRVVRVFVSSTFRDMGAERDELAKRVFPQLRRVCDERGRDLGRGRSPLGDHRRAGRRGQGPADLPCRDRPEPPLLHRPPRRALRVDAGVDRPRLVERRAVARGAARCIGDRARDPARGAQHAQPPTGALRPARPGTSTRWIRASGRSTSKSRPDEIERYGSETSDDRAADRSRRLDALKERIRASGFPIREGYADPRPWVGSCSRT